MPRILLTGNTGQVGWELQRALAPLGNLSASGHTSRYEFAQATIRIMKELSGTADGWAEIKPITCDQFPQPAKQPRNPVTDKSKLKRVFGIEMPHWQHQLRSCLATLVAGGESRK